MSDRNEARRALAAALYVHGPVLLAAARTMTTDEAEAQDLVRATFEIALRRLSTLRDPAALRYWLLRVETREAMRLTRRMRRFVRLDGRVREIAAPNPGMTDRLALRQALAALPLRVRAAVALHHLAGLTVAQTADALGMSENTVKTELKIGLARLRKELSDG